MCSVISFALVGCRWGYEIFDLGNGGGFTDSAGAAGNAPVGSTSGSGGIPAGEGGNVANDAGDGGFGSGTASGSEGGTTGGAGGSTPGSAGTGAGGSAGAGAGSGGSTSTSGSGGVVPSCLPTMSVCSGTCVSTSRNPNYCGGCTNACAPNVGCNASTCSVPEAADLIALINTARADAGCAALTMDGRLMAAAQFLSNDMAFQNYINDNCLASDGSTCTERMAREGYIVDRWGELNAWTYPTAADVFDFWIGRPAYRGYLLNCTFAHIGVGHAYDAADQNNVTHGSRTEGPYYHYWTLELATELP